MPWLTTILELLFAGAMLALATDLAKGRLGWRRPLIIGGMAAAFLLASLAELLGNWASVLQRGPVVIQPLQSVFATVYSVDRLGELVVLTVLVVGIAVAVYTALTLSASDRIGPFYALLMLLVGCSIGVISSGDFLTLFLFWEGLSIAAYGLVSFERRDVSLEAAMKYFFLAGAGSLVYLFGVAIVYSAVGSIRLADLPLLLSSNPALGVAALLMVLMGLGVEVAIFPAHTWLPDAYSVALAPAGAFLGGAVTGTAVFAVLKVVQPLIPSVGSALVQEGQVVLAALSVLTMLVGNLGAFAQGNLRRMLAFSSVAQTGYLLAALSTFTPLGLIAVTFHIWNQGLVKSGFFMLTGVGGKREFEEADIERLRGAGRRNRPLGVLYTASSLAMVGAPPFGMFWSEILVIESLLLAPALPFFWVAVAVLLNVVLSIGYYYRVINTVVFGSSPAQATSGPSRDMVPPSILLGLSLATGLVPALIISLLA